MPDLVEQMYCSQQIHIPPTFPYILKQYCKAAIRTQPYDLLRWSAAYFRCLACNEAPPVKERLEFPPTDYPTGLTPGYLRVLMKQFADKEFVTAEEIWLRWRGICLEEEPLKEIFMLGEFETEVDVLKFIAICAGYLSVRLSRTMILICEILTEEPECGSAMIPYETFIKMYIFLAQMNCGPVEDWENEPQEDAIEGRESARESASLSEHSCERDVPSEPSVEEIEMEPQPSDSVAELKCESGESIQLTELERDIKDAIWSALLEKLPEEVPEEHSEEYNQLKEDLWQAVLENLPPDDESGTHRGVLGQIADAIPAVSEAQKGSKSQLSEEAMTILKDAIWNAIKEKLPDVNKDEYLAKYKEKMPYKSNADEVREILWEAVVERIPSLKREAEVSIADKWPYGYKGMVPPRHPPGYVHPRLCPPPVRVPGYTCPKAEELKPGWLGTRVAKYRIHVKGIGPVIPQEMIEAVIMYLEQCAENQEGMVMPRNIRHFLCPPLDLEGTDELQGLAPPTQDRIVSVEEELEEEGEPKEKEEEEGEEPYDDGALEELPKCRSPPSSDN